MKPKISAILNNCALNVALTMLLDDIEHYAALEAGGDPLPTADPVYRSHLILRQKFVEAHGLTPPLTWVSLQSVINSYQRNFFLLQVVFAQPLRAFIKEKGAPVQDYTLQNNGRFINLRPDEVKVWYYQPFGINVSVYDTPAMNLLGEANMPPDELLCDPKGAGRLSLNIYSDPFSPPDTTHFELEHLHSEAEKVAIVQQEFADKAELAQLIPGFNDTALGSTREATLEQFLIISRDIQTKVRTQEVHVAAVRSLESTVAPAADEPVEATTSYQNYVRKLLSMFHNNQLIKDDSIDLDKIDDVKAREGESDEDFAKRLQEAEIRRSLRKP